MLKTLVLQKEIIYRISKILFVIYNNYNDYYNSKEEQILGNPYNWNELSIVPYAVLCGAASGEELCMQKI